MTKHFLRSLIIFLAIPITSYALAQDSSETPSKPSLSIGIVNIEKVQLQSLAFTSLRTQVEALQSGIQKQIKEQQELIQKEQDEIETQRLLLSNQVLAEKNEALKEKVTELRQFADNANRSLETAYSRALLLIQSKLQESIYEVSKQRNLSLILNENNIPPTVLYSQESLRIDNDVLSQLNQRISDITISKENISQNPSDNTNQ